MMFTEAHRTRLTCAARELQVLSRDESGLLVKSAHPRFTSGATFSLPTQRVALAPIQSSWNGAIQREERRRKFLLLTANPQVAGVILMHT